MNTSALAIDLAKNVFQLHGINIAGKAKLKKRLSRKELMPFITNLQPCTIFIEACSGSHNWSRRFQAHGHTVNITSPQYVKPYVKGNKNDANDAQAILEAGLRPHMNFVPAKTIQQQDIQCVHRVRESFIKRRTALGNQVRGFLAEFGIVIPQSLAKLRSQVPTILSDYDNELTDETKQLMWELYDELTHLDELVKKYDTKLDVILKSNEVCQRIAKIPGVGVVSATAAFASIGDATVFKNGRHFAAYLGLVPKQHSSGNKQKLMGISKRGDAYLRTLLIQGAKSAVRTAKNHETKRGRWVVKLEERRGNNIASVAVANKNARIIWSIMANNTEFNKAA